MEGMKKIKYINMNRNGIKKMNVDVLREMNVIK
jgi:hypothetical protein